MRKEEVNYCSVQRSNTPLNRLMLLEFFGPLCRPNFDVRTSLLQHSHKKRLPQL